MVQKQKYQFMKPDKGRNMVKDAIIAALLAYIAQPFWTTTAFWEVVVTYGLTLWCLFVLIVDLEEWWIERRRDDRI